MRSRLSPASTNGANSGRSCCRLPVSVPCATDNPISCHCCNKRYVDTPWRNLDSKACTIKDIPSLPRGNNCGGADAGAVAMPGNARHWQLARRRLRRTTRRYALTSIFNTSESWVPAISTKPSPHFGQPQGSTSITCSSASRSGCFVRPCPCQPGCCPRDRVGLEDLSAGESAWGGLMESARSACLPKAC